MTLGPYTFEDSDKGKPKSQLLIVVMILFLGVQYQRQSWPFCDCHRQVIPDERQDIQPEPDASLDLEGSFLVIVEESQARGVERMEILNDYQFWFGLRDRGLQGFRLLDPDSPDSKSFVREAARSSIAPPFVMHVSEEGKVIQTIPFPREIAQIEEMLK